MQKEDNLISIPMRKDEIAVLLETLAFARKAAITFSTEEIKRVAGMEAARSFRLIAQNAEDLYDYMSKHLNIGEPESPSVN